MKYPFVSVVVLAYNEEATIGACLNSLVLQDYPKDKYEIIVIDNNSTDRTIEIVRSFKIMVVEEKR